MQWPLCWTSVYICGRASTLLRNLFFLSLTVLLTGCTNTEVGGDFPSGWDPSFSGQQGTFTCDGASGQYAEFYCETGDHFNMCDC